MCIRDRYKARDTIEYQLNFQVSDYFALNNVTLEDILSDGQEIDASFTPTISFQQQANGNNFTNQPFAGPNVTSTINGDGTQFRDFVYVEDVARANIMSMKSDVDHEFFNVGTNTSITILDLAKTNTKVVRFANPLAFATFKACVLFLVVSD